MRDPIEIVKENIQRLLNETGLNQTQLAERIGIDQSVISKIQKDVQRNPTIDTLSQIVRPFNKTLRWLLTDHRQIFVDDHSIEDCYDTIGKALGFLNPPTTKFLSVAEPPLLERKKKGEK